MDKGPKEVLNPEIQKVGVFFFFLVCPEGFLSSCSIYSAKVIQKEKIRIRTIKGSVEAQSEPSNLLNSQKLPRSIIQSTSPNVSVIISCLEYGSLKLTLRLTKSILTNLT